MNEEHGQRVHNNILKLRAPHTSAQRPSTHKSQFIRKKKTASRNLRKSSRALRCLSETSLARHRLRGPKPQALIEHKLGTLSFRREQTWSRRSPWQTIGRHSLGRCSLTDELLFVESSVQPRYPEAEFRAYACI